MSKMPQKQLELDKSKSLVKKKDNAQIEKTIDEKVGDLVLNLTSKIAGDPDLLIEKLKMEIKKVSTREGKITSRVKKEDLRKAVEIMLEVQMAHGLETHFPLIQLVTKQYLPLVMEFAKQLTIEYDCKTSSERALVHVTVIAYAKILEFTDRLFHNLNANDPWLSHEKNGLKSVLGKELDRANRRFIAALAMLKQIKSPTLEISVRAKTAFVAQNQQINATNNLNTKENEIIDPK